MNAEKLFLEVNHLHDSNIVNAQKTAESAIHIGVLLHQIKEVVGHGNFIPAMAKHAPAIQTRCCQNYMRLAFERLIEEKARQISDGNPKYATVAYLPSGGNSKSETVSDLAVLPPNAIPAEAYEQARQEVNEMKWSELPSNLESKLWKNIHGKDVTELYRDYGIARAKELKVYNPPKAMTPEEKIAAENEQAESLLAAVERALGAITLDLNSKSSKLATRVSPARIKEFLRNTVTVTKALRPLAKRKQSAAEKKAESNKQAIAKRGEAAKAKAKEEPTPKHEFSAYVNRWGRLVVKAYSMSEELEALQSPSVFLVIRHVEAENLESAYTEAAKRYKKRDCCVTIAGKDQQLPADLKR